LGVNDDGLFSTSTNRRRPLLLVALLAPLLLQPWFLSVVVAVKGDRNRGLTPSWLMGVMLSSSPTLLALMKLLLATFSFLSEASDCARS
jgi:hypothetical protein